MDAPREVFVLESLNGKLWIHSTKGPLVFLELEHAEEALAANGGVLDKKWSIMRVNMSSDLSSAPFRNHEAHMCDTAKLPQNSIFLADLRDQVAQSRNQKVVINIPVADMTLVTPTGDLEKLGSLPPQKAPDAEYVELRAKIKAAGGNPRSARKLSTLRAMLAEAEAVAV